MPLEEAQKQRSPNGRGSLRSGLAQYKAIHPDFTGTTAPLIKALPTTESDKAATIINGYKVDHFTAFKNAQGTTGAGNL
jgi:hypothetical protein